MEKRRAVQMSSVVESKPASTSYIIFFSSALLCAKCLCVLALSLQCTAGAIIYLFFSLVLLRGYLLHGRWNSIEPLIVIAGLCYVACWLLSFKRFYTVQHASWPTVLTTAWIHMDGRTLNISSYIVVATGEKSSICIYCMYNNTKCHKFCRSAHAI